jgi:hypothetical protein
MHVTRAPRPAASVGLAHFRVKRREGHGMGAVDELQVQTNASERDVVRAFKEAFFEPPSLSEHFKPTPIAHFRSQITWEPIEVMDSAAAAKLVNVNFNRTFEDLKHYRSETGETIALTYDDGKVRMWVDNEPMIAGVDVTNPLVFHSYAHDVFSRLAHEARLEGYNVPPGAPPGWPFPG